MQKGLVSGLAFAVAALAAACGSTQTASPSSAPASTSTSPPVAWHGAAQAVAIQPDGKIVAAGTRGSLAATGGELALARYTPDGGADRSFGDAGVARASDAASGPAIAILDGGEILAGGKTLVRFDADGTIDRSFGSDGRVDTGFGSAFALQPDGAVVVGGAVDEPAPHIGWRFRLARYTPDGQRDSTFGKDGTATADFGSDPPDHAWDASDYIVGVLVAKDGSIVALGTASSCGMCDESRFAVARYAPGGRIDRAFGGGAVTTVVSSLYSAATAGALQPDGKILLAGGWDDSAGIALARFNPDGRLDESFGKGGQVMTHFRLRPAAAALQRDGKIVLAGRLVPDFVESALVRFDANGAPDRTFGTGGKVLTSGSGVRDAYALAIQPDGKLVVAGESADGAFALARYLPDGRPDASFGR